MPELLISSAKNVMLQAPFFDLNYYSGMNYYLTSNFKLYKTQ